MMLASVAGRRSESAAGGRTLTASLGKHTWTAERSTFVRLAKSNLSLERLVLALCSCLTLPTSQEFERSSALPCASSVQTRHKRILHLMAPDGWRTSHGIGE